MSDLLITILIVAGTVGGFFLWDALQTWKELRQADPRNIPLTTDPNSPEETKQDQLERLEELHQQGVMTEEEYEREKKRIQDGLNAA